jgi:hypothetical protein
MTDRVWYEVKVRAFEPDNDNGIAVGAQKTVQLLGPGAFRVPKEAMREVLDEALERLQVTVDEAKKSRVRCRRR